MTVTTLTHDTASSADAAAGLALAVASATSFGLSGALARGLLDTGWSAGATVAPADRDRRRWCWWSPARWRCAAAGTCCAPTPGWSCVYGIAAVAGAQLCYFYAVTYMQVSVALLLEYTAPVAVVVWLWLRHGHRPSRADPGRCARSPRPAWSSCSTWSPAPTSSTVGVLWALGAMVGAATYFVISADEDNGLPGIALAAGGLLVGGAVLLARRVPPASCRSTPPPPTRSTTVAPWRGGSRSSCSAWSPPRSPTSPASPPVAGSAAGWRRSSRWARCWPPSSGRLAAPRRAAPPAPARRRPARAGRRRGGQARRGPRRRCRSSRCPSREPVSGRPAA